MKKIRIYLAPIEGVTAEESCQILSKIINSVEIKYPGFDIRGMYHGLSDRHSVIAFNEGGSLSEDIENKVWEIGGEVCPQFVKPRNLKFA